jgi:hypothetical protein
MEEEEMSVSTPQRFLYSYQSSLKMYFNSLKRLNGLIVALNEEGLNLNIALSDILKEYIGLNSSKIEDKISDLEKTKELNDLLHLALLQLDSGRTPTGPLLKTTEAGRYLYSLYKVNRDYGDGTYRRTINILLNKTNGRNLVARGPKRGVDVTIYRSDIDKWFKEYGTDFTPRG